MITERDIMFSSDMAKLQIPKDRLWMRKYFKTKTKRKFLKYFLAFGSDTRFRQHMGEACTKRYVKKMKMQFMKIEARREAAKKDLDFELLAKIEMGRGRLN